MSEPIVHRQVALLKVSDPKVIDEVRAVVPLDEFVLAWVSPSEVVVDPARVGELFQRLSDRGLAPLMKRVQSPGPRDGMDPTEPTGRIVR